MPDHIHILIGLNPNDSISDLVGAIKKNSSVFINCSNKAARWRILKNTRNNLLEFVSILTGDHV